PWYDLPTLALFAANPEAIVRFLMLRSQAENPDDDFAIEQAAAGCPVLDLVTATDADRVWRALVTAMREAGEGEASRRTHLAPAAARGLPDYFTNYLALAASPCRPSS